MPAIFITRNIPGPGVQMLRDKGYEVVVSEKEGVLTREELLSALQAKPYDAVLSLLTDKIDATIIDAAPTVKIFSNYATGYDNIDVTAAKARGVLVANAPAPSTPMSVAEHALALLLLVAKRVEEADDFVKAGSYVGWDPNLFLGVTLSGKTLGLVGAGRIGSMFAKMVCGLQMKVLYHDIARNEEFERECGAEYRPSLDALLPEVDVVSLHVPLLDSTRHLIDERRLGLMKRDAIIINTARGAVIDEMALVRALQASQVRGAGLDVFEHEPALTPGLTELPSVVLTPHIASADEIVRQEMSELAAQNIIDTFEGREPANLIKQH